MIVCTYGEVRRLNPPLDPQRIYQSAPHPKPLSLFFINARMAAERVIPFAFAAQASIVRIESGGRRQSSHRQGQGRR